MAVAMTRLRVINPQPPKGGTKYRIMNIEYQMLK